jgi:NAD(P)-dependent dehydrogenase (short-subunit alcohol dehydrogenase family)
LGLAEELREFGIAVNTLWPRTAIATAAVEMLSGNSSRLSWNFHYCWVYADCVVQAPQEWLEAESQILWLMRRTGY